jgi:hypothetical protein
LDYKPKRFTVGLSVASWLGGGGGGDVNRSCFRKKKPLRESELCVVPFCRELTCAFGFPIKDLPCSTAPVLGPVGPGAVDLLKRGRMFPLAPAVIPVIKDRINDTRKDQLK